MAMTEREVEQKLVREYIASAYETLVQHAKTHGHPEIEHLETLKGFTFIGYKGNGEIFSFSIGKVNFEKAARHLVRAYYKLHPEMIIEDLLNHGKATI